MAASAHLRTSIISSYHCLMNENQLPELWAFARGDTAGLVFETWFLAQTDLEDLLGADLHWGLASANYSDKEQIWTLREALAQRLKPYTLCECPTIRDLAAVPMGGDGLDERFFATLGKVTDHGSEIWWLNLSKCNACGQHWMVAQEARIFDEYFLRRLNASEADKVISERIWPDQFLTYERVLKVGLNLSQPCRFLDTLDPSLVWTAKNLREERPSITVEEIADLVGVTPGHAALLITG